MAECGEQSEELLAEFTETAASLRRMKIRAIVQSNQALSPLLEPEAALAGWPAHPPYPQVVKVGCSRSYDSFFILRKDANDSIHRLRCVNRMQSRQNQVACLGRLQCYFDGLAIAHFTDEDDFRSLTQSCTQGQSKTRRI